MKRQNDNIPPMPAAPVLGALVVALSVSFSQQPFAQSADIFVPKADAAASGKPGDGQKVAEPDPVDERPSRNAGPDIAPYTASRAAVFSMRNRVTDPFGLNQDPNVKPPERKLASRQPVKRQAALPPTPLSDIVKLIRVTTIIPGEKKFLVGVRSFSESDEFPLVFGGKTMRMKILEVTARSIRFKNLDNGDIASLETEMLPVGMIAGGDKLRPPGLVSPLDNIPLELGPRREPDANN